MDYKRELIFIIIFVAVGFLIYSNTLHSPFVFDDEFTIYSNEAIKQNTIYTQFNHQRYIGHITFALNYKFNNYTPFGYHLVNIIIHLINTILVYLLMKNLLTTFENNSTARKNNMIPFIIALIFMVHPVQTQAVTYITQRFTSLAALFALGTLLFYVKFRKAEHGSYWYFLLSLISTFLAYKTKENTATLPFIILLIEIMFFKALSTSLKRRIFFLAPYFLLLIFLAVTFINASSLSGNILTKTLESTKETAIMTRTQYLMTEQRVILTYIRLLLIPVKQSVDYFYPLSASFFELRTFLSFCALLLLLIIAIALFKRFPFISFGILWFFIFLSIESTVIPITDVIYEHRVYLPSIGFILALVYTASMVLKKFPPKVFTIFFLILCIALAITAYARNEVWKDSISLWKDAATKFPQNIRCHLNLGFSYAEKGLYDNAIQELTIGIVNDYYDPNTHAILGYCYWKKGLMTVAEKEMNTAIQLAPWNIKYYRDLAIMYFANQNYKAALEILLKAQKINASDPILNAQLGQAYCGAGDLAHAIPYYDKAIQLKANEADFYNERGLCYIYFNKFAESRRNFLKVIELAPHYADSYFLVGITYEMDGNFSLAADYYKKFLSMAPKEHPLFAQALARLRNK